MSRESLRVAVVGACLVLAAAAVAHWRAFDAADRGLLDAEFQVLRERFPQSLARDVVVVGIDAETVRRLPEPPSLWHRHYGELLNGLAPARPAVVALDVPLPDRSYEFIAPGSERALSEAIATARRAIPLLVRQSTNDHGERRPVAPAIAAALDSKMLVTAAGCPDADGVVRRYGDSCDVPANGTPLAQGMAQQLGISGGWSGYVDYALGDPIAYVPLHEVLGWIRDGDSARMAAAFAGRPVLVTSLLSAGEQAGVPIALAAFVPESRVVPLSLVEAQALRSMMQRGLIQPVPPVIVVLLAIAAAGFWFGRGRALKAGVLLAALALLFAAALHLLWKGSYLPAATLGLVASVAAGLRFAYEARDEIRERRFLRQAFGGYVSPRILKDILRGHITADVSGTRENVCVLYCNLRGFSARAESSAPDEVIDLLNDYFTGLTTAVQDHGGTTNKFLGDGLLAFFGAPLPLENPAKNALEAAQDMLVSVHSLNRRLAGVQQQPLECGIALHSGNVVVGQVGGAAHREYAAIGQVVATTLALEKASRAHGYPVVCTGVVAEAVGATGGLVALGRQPAAQGTHALYGWLPPLTAHSASPALAQGAQ
jgi:class 3 adenylate cyclase/CHASE2 domain-containing sensor protein